MNLYRIFRYDLNLPVILDYEIWKASFMLTQSTTPYDDEEENNDSDGSKAKEGDWDDAFKSVDTYS